MLDDRTFLSDPTQWPFDIPGQGRITAVKSKFTKGAFPRQFGTVFCTTSGDYYLAEVPLPDLPKIVADGFSKHFKPTTVEDILAGGWIID